METGKNRGAEDRSYGRQHNRNHTYKHSTNPEHITSDNLLIERGAQ